MTKIKETDSKKSSENPDLKDVESGSDADANPLPEVGKTPPDPNGIENDADKPE